jgi:hypothetical protein
VELSEITTKIDEYYLTREKRLELDRQSEEIQKVERVLKDEIISYMEAEHAGVVGGMYATVKLKITPKPSAKNWAEIWEWVKANDAPDVYYQRLSEKALTERREHGVNVPGVEWYPVASISVSKGASK